MKKKILIVLSEGFEDVEGVSVIDVLNRAGIEVTVASLSEGPVKAAYGTVILPQTTLDKAGDDFDGIVLPGGVKNARILAENMKVLDLVRKFESQGKLVGAICAAPSLVLSQAAGVLKGRPATGAPGFEKELASGGAIVTGQAVTSDGNIITGMGPGAALEFALTLAEYLGAGKAVEELRSKWRMPKQVSEPEGAKR